VLKNRILIFAAISVLLLTGCWQSGEDDLFLEEMFQLSADAERAYMENNPDYFDDILSNGFSISASGLNYCAYDIQFHELRLIDLKYPEDCIKPSVIRSSISPLTEHGRIALYGYNSTLAYDASDYEAGLYYSSLTIYVFDENESAQLFAEEFHRKVKREYESHYITFEPLDQPRYSIGESALKLVGYERAIPSFIKYEDESAGIFHTIVFVGEEFVYVHKIYNNETRVFVNY
jgi:hypothetical protein